MTALRSNPQFWRWLRARRKAAGLPLEQVHVKTRIPVDHLRALEDGRVDEIPPGPYLNAYLRAYCSAVGVDPRQAPVVETSTPVEEEPESEPWLPLWVVRTAAVVLLGLAVVGMGWRVVEGDLQGLWPDRSSAFAEAPAPPDQHVRLSARRAAEFQVIVDGEIAFDGRLKVGQTVAFAGRDRVEVALPAAEAARVEYNDEVIVPQGRQTTPRRLIFIDDLQADQ